LKRHKGSTREVPKCRYYFGVCRREDITAKSRAKSGVWSELKISCENLSEVLFIPAAEQQRAVGPAEAE
jgi:hypothetical protein